MRLAKPPYEAKGTRVNSIGTDLSVLLYPMVW
jgi:hypothetical protein